MKSLLKTIVVFILTLEARLVLARYQPKIIAITGSVGKTSAKEATYHALAGTYFTRKSQKSFNSEIGVPLTILDAENAWSNPLAWIVVFLRGLWLALWPHPYPQWLVVEVGADHPGDVRRTAKWLRPHIAVITGVPDMPVHMLYFPSADAVAEEKYELARGMRGGGTLIVNGDDARARRMRERFSGTAISYGFADDCEVRASHVETRYADGRPVGIRFDVHVRGTNESVVVRGGLGTSHVYSILAASAAAAAAGMDPHVAAATFATYVPIPGRMRVHDAVNGATLIDDSYNASPAATLLALDTLAALETSGKKIALLGDMRELGTASKDAHELVGRRAAEVLDVLGTVGVETKILASAARQAGLSAEAVHEYLPNQSVKAGQDIAARLSPGDVVLVKGSQNILRMERASFELLKDKEHATDLLPRQDEEWRRR